jgi:hypothetical protein
MKVTQYAVEKNHGSAVPFSPIHIRDAGTAVFEIFFGINISRTLIEKLKSRLVISAGRQKKSGKKKNEEFKKDFSGFH